MMNYEFSEIELRRLDLNLLLVFSALMREGSVNAASRRLFIGPSAVSMALARLRQTLGDELFVRTASGMEPTPRAETLWTRLGPSLAAIDLAVRDLDRFDLESSDITLRFAAPDDLECVLVPLLLEKLEARAPGMRLVVRSSDFRALVRQLDDGEADVALGATPRRGLERRHRTKFIYRESFRVLYDPARIGSCDALSLDDYTAIPHLFRSVSGDLTGAMDEALARLGQSRRVVAALSHFPTVPFVLKSRRALVNVPATAARHLAAAHGLAVCELPFPSPQFDVSLVWHARTDTDPAHSWFRELVLESIEEILGKTKLPG